MSANIFISFASKDSKVALTLCQALEGRGFNCWISARDIQPGENFQSAIVHAIREAKIMLLVFTANSNNSEEMNKELALASQNKLMVVPLRVEDVAPNDAFAYEFATRQWIDFFADWEFAIQQLSVRIEKALGQMAPKAEPPPAIAPPAAEPPPVSAQPPVAAKVTPPVEPKVEAAAPVAEAAAKSSTLAKMFPAAAGKADVAPKADPKAKPPEAKAQPEPKIDVKAKAKAAPAPVAAAAARPVGAESTHDHARPGSRRKDALLVLAAIVILAMGAAVASTLLRTNPSDKPDAERLMTARSAAQPAGVQTIAAPATPAAAAATVATDAAATDAPVEPVRKRKKAAAPAHVERHEESDVPY